MSYSHIHVENNVADNILIETKDEVKIVEDNPPAKIIDINRNNRYLTEEEDEGTIAWFNLYPNTITEPLRGMTETSNYGNSVCFAYTLDSNNFTAKTWVSTVLSYKDVVYTSMPLDTDQIFFWYYAVNISTVTSCNSSSVTEATSATSDSWQNLNLDFVGKYGQCYSNHFIGIAPDEDGASARTFPMDETPRPRAPKVELLTYNWAIGHGFCDFGLNGRDGFQIFNPDPIEAGGGKAWYVDTCPRNATVEFKTYCNQGTLERIGLTSGCKNTATLLAAIGRSGSSEHPLEAFSMQGNTCTPCTSGDDVCFAGSETVLLESGEMKLMQDVNVGDRVQVSSNDGSLLFSDVVFLPHESNQKLSYFIELETNFGSLKVTEKHLIRVSSDCSSNDNEFELIFAEDIEIGQCLDHVDGKSEVINTQLTQATGVYTIITAHSDGIVVVNGFKASSFGVNHMIPNMYYHLHRFLYTIGLTSKQQQQKQSLAKETLMYMGNILGNLANISF